MMRAVAIAITELAKDGDENLIAERVDLIEEDH
jgi:hypothetical protein